MTEEKNRPLAEEFQKKTGSTVTPVPALAQQAYQAPAQDVAEAMRAVNRQTLIEKQEAEVAAIAAPQAITAPLFNGTLTRANPSLPIPAGFQSITLLDGREIQISEDFEAIELRGRATGPVKAIVVVGPPRTAFMLAMTKIFKNREVESATSFEMEAQIARTISYVRSINGRDLPDPLTDWNQVLAVVHELGDLGERAVRECISVNWPQGGGVFWSSVKKNLPE